MMHLKPSRSSGHVECVRCNGTGNDPDPREGSRCLMCGGKGEMLRKTAEACLLLPDEEE
jgi:DnaJ-class molecular chaperone